MAANLTKIRKEASLIGTYIKQDKVYPALMALKNALVAYIGTPLMRQEKEEFGRFIDEGARNIMLNPRVKQEFPMDIRLTPGKEKDLLDTVNIMLESFTDDLAAVANIALKDLQAKQQQMLNEGLDLYAKGKEQEASVQFENVYKDEHTSGADLAKIADLYMDDKKYTEAAHYFEQAIRIEPDNADYYNKIAIALRRIGRYDEAEQYYFKVSKIIGKCDSLFFNLARLYLEWGKDAKAIQAAEGALKMNPNFQEAQKLINYVHKQAAKEK